MIISIGTINSLEEIKAFPRNNWPHKNTIIAKGKVSKRGALEEISPSLFSPRLRLMNDPALSPTRHAKPRKVPRMNADINSLPTLNHESSKPVSGWAKIVASMSLSNGASHEQHN